MQMLYNSDSFAVMQFDVPTRSADGAGSHAGGTGGTGATGATGITARGGFEIIDKFARKEIYLQGAVAESFQRGVEALVQQGPSEESLDDFIAGYTTWALQPVVLH